MDDKQKTKEQLITEISRLREKIHERELESKELREKFDTTLKGNGEKYDYIFRNTSDAIFIHDMEGNILDANQRWLDLFGYTKDEILTCKISQLHPPKDQKILEEGIKRVLRECFISLETTFIKKNGEIFTAEVIRSLLSLDSGQVVQGLIRNISDRKRTKEELRKSEETYRTLAKNSPEAIRIFNETSHLYANQACLDLLGYEWEELKDMNGWAVVAPEYREWTRERGMKRLRGDKMPVKGKSELPMLHKDGSKVFTEVFASLVHMNGQPAILSFMRDITESKLASERLQESEDRFRRLFEQSNDGIILHQLERIIDCNQRMCEMVGYKKDKLINNSVSSLLPPKDRKDMGKKIQSIIDGTPKIFESYYNKADGTRVDVEVSASVVDKKKGIIQSIIRDISERKNKEREMQLFRHMIDQSNDAIHVIDPETGQILLFNDGACKGLGYEVEEMLNMKIADIAPRVSSNPALDKIKFNNELKKGQLIFEGNHQRKDGSMFPVEVHAQEVTYEGKRYFFSVARNIEERKKYEMGLKKAKEDAEAANKTKDEFLANMSHEIRTPLNGVLGVLNLLLSTDPDNEQLDLIETGKRSADNLLTVLNDILDFSKIQARELDLEILDFNLRNAIEEVVELPAMQAHERGVEFLYEIHHEVPSLLRGDPGRLRQILLNMTNNAIKFTKNGEVFVRIFLEEETDTHAKIRFEVRDTGIGISEDKLGTVFESFKQTDSSTTRKYGGTGLGLSIAKRLAELMGGEVGVESEPGKGSTFWFTARFEKQPRAEERILVPPPNIKGKRFLLVDDNRTNLEILKGYVEAWGCSCDVANTGEMALNLMNAVAKVDAPFDAAIIDMRMPGMDGEELGRRIKGDPKLKDITMIMLTSLGLRGDAARMEKVGYAAYLTKPVRRSQLYDSLVMVLGSKKQKSFRKKSQIVTKYTLSEERRNQTRLLIVEDNIVNQKLVLRMVEKSGFKGDIAANGKEALRSLESFKYDIVLMDVQMPEMDGFEATKKIRDPESSVIDHDIPIIAMTAHAMKGDRNRCLEIGMNDYVSKPIQPQELLDTIEKHILFAEGIERVIS